MLHRAPRLPARLGLLTLVGLGGCIEQGFVEHEGDDIFYQVEAGEVDVLLVVDNSCSMQPYQNELSENFDQFLTFFVEGDVDYQIGVVTSSVAEPVAAGGCSEADVADVPEAGHLVDNTWITPDTPNGADKFRDLVRVGVCGSGYEMGIESAYRAVSPPLSDGQNGGFIRPDAYLSLIFVSDEQDASPLPVNQYINGFRSVKGQRNRDIFNASALVVTQDTNCNTDLSNPGTRYLDIARQTGGVIGDICADDFGSIVTELSLASSRLEDTFYLSELPDASSLIVGIDDEEIPCSEGRWQYQLLELDGEDRGAIVFDRAQMPPPNSRVTVRYDHGSGDPSSFCGAGGDE